jgi:Zn-dependent protease/CBS domain-containing protein
MGNSFKIGRIFGIDIGVHWSWLFIFVVVTWSFATGVFEHFYPDWSAAQRWIGGAIVAGIFFLSILAHELSHAVVSNRNKLPVRDITLFVFGGVSNLSREPDTPGLEFKIAIVGPLTSLALGGLFAIGWAVIRPASDGIAGISANLALINASLAVFNMLPGFPLDGGRVFRSIVWARNHNRLRATHTASQLGEWIAYGVMGIGVVYTFFGDFGGLWFIIIGFFLRGAATASYEQLLLDTTLSKITVSDVMRRDVPSVSPDLSVEQLVHDHLLSSPARCFAVDAGGDFAGLITLTDVRKVPKEQWAGVSVYRAMTPASRLHTVQPTESITKVLQLMSLHDINQLPVMRGRELVGIVHRSDVMRYIEVRKDLDEARPDGSTEQEPRENASTGAPR